MKTLSIEKYKLNTKNPFNSICVPKDSQILSFENKNEHAYLLVLVDKDNKNEVRYFISVLPNYPYLKTDLKDSKFIGMARFGNQTDDKKATIIYLFEVVNSLTIKKITGRY